jgi:hypothetical protein
VLAKKIAQDGALHGRPRECRGFLLPPEWKCGDRGCGVLGGEGGYGGEARLRQRCGGGNDGDTTLLGGNVAKAPLLVTEKELQDCRGGGGVGGWEGHQCTLAVAAERRPPWNKEAVLKIVVTPDKKPYPLWPWNFRRIKRLAP